MKPSLAALLVLSAAASLAQEPSAKDLRGLLHADVKQYANDGRLVASWSLANADQLNAFKRQDEKAIKIASGEGLSMTVGGHALCLFKELELEQPCRLTFEVRLAEPSAAFEMNLIDSDHPQARAFFALNLNGSFDVVARVENGKPVGTPRRAGSGVNAAGWGQVAIDLRGDRASLTVNKVEQGALDGISIKRFVPAFGAAAGSVTVRNLAIDAQVNRDSIRKLFRSVAAARPASRPKLGADAGAVSRTAWQKVEEECASIDASGIGDAAAAEINALPAEAQAAIEAAIEPRAKPKDALASFEKALKIAPKSAVLLWLTGMAAADADLPDKAIEHLEKSVAANAKFGRAWVALGRRRAERGEDALALKAFTQAETADPADPWVHVARARLAFDRGRLDEARCDIGKACTKRAESESLKALSKSLDRLAVRPDWKDPFKKENQWFVVETTISSKVAAEMAQRLVVYRRFLEKAFPLPLKQAPPPSRVWIFDSEDEYHQFASSLANGMDGTVGLYHKLIKTLLLTSKVSTGATQHILFHEGFHQYLDLAVPQAPIWMNEGLAEYFGATTFDVSGKATEGGIVEMRLGDLRGPIVPLDKLMLMSQPAYMNPREAPRHYAQSWALVHYLKQGGNAQATKLFDFYCTAVITGRSQADAFNLSFGRDGGAEFAAIEREFRIYVSERLLKQR